MAHRHFQRTQTGGRWSPSFSDDTFIKTVESINQGTPKQIAEKVKCSTSLAQIRLKKLKSDGFIDGELIGHSWVYRKCEQ